MFKVRFKPGLTNHSSMQAKVRATTARSATKYLTFGAHAIAIPDKPLAGLWSIGKAAKTEAQARSGQPDMGQSSLMSLVLAGGSGHDQCIMQPCRQMHKVLDMQLRPADRCALLSGMLSTPDCIGC